MRKARAIHLATALTLALALTLVDAQTSTRAFDCNNHQLFYIIYFLRSEVAGGVESYLFGSNCNTSESALNPFPTYSCY